MATCQHIECSDVHFHCRYIRRFMDFSITKFLNKDSFLARKHLNFLYQNKHLKYEGFLSCVCSYSYVYKDLHCTTNFG